MYNNQKQKHNGTCECEISISELANVIAVSYTHLDVYKRQMLLEIKMREL